MYMHGLSGVPGGLGSWPALSVGVGHGQQLPLLMFITLHSLKLSFEIIHQNSWNL